MGKKGWILFGIAAVVWHLIGRTAAAIYRLQFRLLGITPAGLSPEGYYRANLTLGIYNPSSATVLLRSLNAQILFNGVPVAYIGTQVNRYIYGNSINQITFVTDLDPNNFKEAMLDQLFNGRIDNWLLTVTGTVSVDNVPEIPFSIDFVWEDLIG